MRRMNGGLERAAICGKLRIDPSLRFSTFGVCNPFSSEIGTYPTIRGARTLTNRQRSPPLLSAGDQFVRDSVSSKCPEQLQVEKKGASSGQRRRRLVPDTDCGRIIGVLIPGIRCKPVAVGWITVWKYVISRPIMRSLLYIKLTVPILVCAYTSLILGRGRCNG
jgi:hypothetical protein